MRIVSTWKSLPDDVVAHETLGSFKRAIRCCVNEKLFSFRLACFVKIFLLAIYLFTLSLFCLIIALCVFCYLFFSLFF